MGCSVGAPGCSQSKPLGYSLRNNRTCKAIGWLPHWPDAPAAHTSAPTQRQPTPQAAHNQEAGREQAGSAAAPLGRHGEASLSFRSISYRGGGYDLRQPPPHRVAAAAPTPSRTAATPETPAAPPPRFCATRCTTTTPSPQCLRAPALPSGDASQRSTRLAHPSPSYILHASPTSLPSLPLGLSLFLFCFSRPCSCVCMCVTRVRVWLFFSLGGGRGTCETNEAAVAPAQSASPLPCVRVFVCQDQARGRQANGRLLRVYWSILTRVYSSTSISLAS